MNEQTSNSDGMSRFRRFAVRMGVGALVLGSITVGAVSTSSISASATPNVDKVTLCHATSSNSNPYVLITVDPASILSEGQGSHADDIIPPFGDYPGLNWDDAHRAIFNNRCKSLDTSCDSVDAQSSRNDDESSDEGNSCNPCDNSGDSGNIQDSGVSASHSNDDNSDEGDNGDDSDDSDDSCSPPPSTDESTTTTTGDTTTTTGGSTTTTAKPPTKTNTTTTVKQNSEALLPTTTVDPGTNTTSSALGLSPLAPIRLPVTGGSSDTALLLASIGVLVGLAMTMFARRRRSA